MSHLRRYLERTAALPADELDMAVRRQQIYGGSIDSVLLELELVDAHTLGELLVHACGLPLAPFEMIDDERDRPWAALPDDVLEIGWAVPLVERGDQVWIAVHPDLPNERLGALYRAVPNVHPFVIPECCLEKIAAERSSSVVPQRYAVLCVAYLSALRRRPSVSDIGFPMLHDPGSGGSAGVPLFDLPPQRVRATTGPPPGESQPIAIDRDPPDEPEDEFERRATIVFEPGAIERVIAASHKRTQPPVAPPPRASPPGEPLLAQPLTIESAAIEAISEPIPLVRTELSPTMTAAPVQRDADAPRSGSPPGITDSGPLA
ncbi:MAG: hypothetical protein IAG13_20965, partial [Deltaproteobacteria bacterium]|nr:hypothetical protein [Nannocystaceae bacterium]